MKLPIRTLALVALTSLPLAQGGFAKGVAELKAREAKVKKVVADTMPSVVAIVGKERPATGSGVVISEDGLIMTAGHVTDAAGQELTIIFPDGRTVSGKSLGANRTRDAGLAQITDEGKWPHASIGDSESVKLGDWVVAMGHPGGYDLNRTPPVRLGRVVNLGQMGMIGTDSTLVGGDSGGPLFNLDGKVVGIHSSIGGSLAENRHVPSEVFKKGWDRMVDGDVWGNLAMMAGGVDPNRPMLGIQMSEDGGKVSVASVLPNSPASKAGVRAGDVVLKIDSTSPESMADVADYVSSQKAGEEVKVRVSRGGEEKEFGVKLVRWADLAGDMRRPDPRREDVPPVPAKKRASFGAMLDAEAAGKGATLFEVMQGSPADKAGFEAGDVILEIDGKSVSDAEGMADLLKGYKPGARASIRFMRDEDLKDTKIEFGAR